MADLNLEQVAADLAKTAAALDRHIAAKGKEIGDAHGLRYAKAADERIKDKDLEVQRLADLVAELRRQMKPLERHARAGFTLEMRIREVARIANERGEGGLAQVLLQAIADAQRAGREEPNQTAPGLARSDEEG